MDVQILSSLLWQRLGRLEIKCEANSYLPLYKPPTWNTPFKHHVDSNLDSIWFNVTLALIATIVEILKNGLATSHPSCTTFISMWWYLSKIFTFNYHYCDYIFSFSFDINLSYHTLGLKLSSKTIYIMLQVQSQYNLISILNIVEYK
jgi:hypothetical protein